MKNKKYYQYIINLLRPYKAKIAILFILMVMTAVGNMFIPLVQEQIVDVGIIEKQMDVLVQLVIFSIVVYILISFLSYIQNKIQVTINCDFTKKLQEKAIAHLQRIKKDVLDREGVLKLTKNVDYYIDSMTQVTGSSVLQMGIEAFKLIGIIVALLLINWQLALYSLAFIPIRLLITAITGYCTELYSQRNISEHHKLHQWEEDLYATIPEIKLYDLYEKRNGEYSSQMNSIMKILKKLSMVSAKDIYVGEGVSQTMFTLLYMIAGIMIWKDTLTIGGLLVIASYFTYVIDPVDLFSAMGLVFANVKPAIDKYEEFMSLPEENEVSDVKLIELNCEPVLKIENLSFSYGSNEIFKRVNITFEKGKKYVLVGENGAGKTTLLDLILCFIDIQDGTIKLRGTDIRKYGVSRLRENFGVVTQQTNLFHTTVRDNITLFGKYKLQETIMSHKLFDFINFLRDGLECDVGNKATQLSGGEKQKIALARALMKQPDILILDEPTSNYDIESKKQFYDLISGLECTAIIISHDPEIMQSADGIVLIEDGSVHQFRNYEEFLEYGSKIMTGNKLEARDNVNGYHNKNN